MITTIRDIERKKEEEWKKNCKKEVISQLILNKLKKKKIINKNQSNVIQGKINELGKDNLQTFNIRKRGK